MHAVGGTRRIVPLAASQKQVRGKLLVPKYVLMTPMTAAVVAVAMAAAVAVPEMNVIASVTAHSSSTRLTTRHAWLFQMHLRRLRKMQRGQAKFDHHLDLELTHTLPADGGAKASQC